MGLINKILGVSNNPSGFRTNVRKPNQCLLVGNTRTGGGIANTLISGIDYNSRYCAYEIVMEAALNEGKNIICLYDGNSNMYSFIDSFCNKKSKKLIVFGNNSNNYDPLASMSLDEFCVTIGEIGYSTTRFNSDTATLLEILKIIKEKNAKNITFSSFAKCKYDKLDGVITNLHLTKRLSDSEELHLKGLLNASLKEQFNLKALFNNISNESDGCISDGVDGLSIKSAIQTQDAIILIKLDSNQNKAFGKLIINELYNYLQNTKNNLLVMDNYLIPRDFSCYRYIASQPTNSKWLIGTDNVCSLCLNEEKDIDFIFQNARRFVILRHTDSSSSERFANFLGKFTKSTVDKGKTHGATFLGFTSRDKISYTSTVKTVEEYRFKPDYIQSIPFGRGIYRDFDCNDISIQVFK